MEAFKGILRRRVALYAALLVLFVAASVVAPLFRADMPGVDDHTLGMVRGFQSGIFAGLSILLLRQLILALRALRNEEARRKLYVQEKDERRRFILDKMGGFAYNLAMGAVGAAGCIAGYFNLTVSATLLLTLAGMALLKAVFKVYYRNRF